MPNKKNNSNSDLGTATAIGAGVVAMVAAGYFLFGPNGKKNRKNIKGWTVKMKGEVLEKIEGAKEITEPIYHKIVDSVATKYLSSENKSEVEAIVNDLKGHWKNISKNTKKPIKKARK